jgi:hypothetical protein
VLTDVPRVEYVQGTLYGLIEDDSLRRARAVRSGYDDDPDDDPGHDRAEYADGPDDREYDEEPRRRGRRRRRPRH